MSGDDDEEFKTEFIRGGTPILERRSRTSAKRERVANEEALSELVKNLIALPQRMLGELELPEFILDGIVDAKRIKDPSSLDRHLRHVRSLLRDLEWQPMLRRIDHLRAGLGQEEQVPTVSLEWAETLLIQGDPGLARFLEEYPEADRARLRQLVQNVKRTTDGKRAKARRQLEVAVANTLGRAAHDAPDEEEDDD